MKRLFRVGTALMLLAAILVLAPAALAQDTPTFGLSDSDYTQWTTANATSVAFNTLSLDFTASLTASGLSDSDISANLTGSAAIDTAGLFSLTVTGDINDGTTSTPVNLEARVVDDMIYVDLGDGTGWHGGKAEDVMSGLSSAFASGAGLPVDPSSLASGDLSGLMNNPEAMSALSALSSLDPESFITITRSDADGLAQFDIAVSIADLLKNPAIVGLMSSAGGSGTQMTDAQVQQMSAMMGMMFADAVFTFDQYVDTGSNLVKRAVLNFSLPLTAMGMGANSGVNLVFDVNLNNYNDPVTVEAPSDFTPFDMGTSK